MDPITLISAATQLVSMTGLDKKIGQLFGGEQGAEVARKVVGIAANVTGQPDPAMAVNKLQSDPQMQIEFERALMDNELSLLRVATADRADARAMQVAALQSDSWLSKRFIYIFALAWSAFSMIYIAAITFIAIPEPSQRFADTILGFLLATAMGGMFGYFFGSSQGSKAKGDAQHALMSSMAMGLSGTGIARPQSGPPAPN